MNLSSSCDAYNNNIMLHKVTLAEITKLVLNIYNNILRSFNGYDC